MQISGGLILSSGVNISTPVISSAGDPYWDNVVSQLRFEGGNGAAIVDDKGLTWNSQVNGTISTANIKHGTSSFHFASTGSAAITKDSGGFPTIGTQDFTLELWFNTDGIRGQALWDGRPSGTNGAYPLISMPIDSPTQISYYVNGATRISGGTVIASQWHHVAVSKVSGTTRLFLDGVEVGSFADNFNYAAFDSTRPTIGNNAFNDAFDFTGYMDDIRVTLGVGRYTGNFTPPNALPVN